jgi:hypothetical protein
MKVFLGWSLIGNEFLQEERCPVGDQASPYGDFVALLLIVRATEDDPVPGLSIDVQLGKKKTEMQSVHLPIEDFLARREYDFSQQKPLRFDDIAAIAAIRTGMASGEPHHPLGVWLFRDAIYFTDRNPRPAELDEVELRIRALSFQKDEGIRRLREQVANYEAVETRLRGAPTRQPIPDDVKLLVWTRDGGACVKCGVARDLHFDHVIPVSRGGGTDAENIQLLCRACNLSKSDRIA